MLSRRTALKGGTAAAMCTTAIAVTGAVAARVAVADPVIGLIRETKTASAAWDAAESALDKARHKVGYENAPIWALVEVQTDAGPRIYGPSEIELAATPEGCYGTHITAEQRDRYLPELRRREEAGRKLCRELGLEPYLIESESRRDRFRALFREVCETPAQTAQGFAAKTVFLCEEAEEDSPREELVRSVKADAERLAGRAAS